MWPSGLSNPLGWVRLAKQHEGLGYAVAGLAIALSLGVGWLVMLLVRPKDRRAALAFASATALVATLPAFMFVGPFEAVAGSIQIHPIEEDYHATLLITQSAGRNPIPPTDLDYLKGYLPPEKRNLRYTGWGSDILNLRTNARYANRLYVAFNGMWTTVVLAAALFLSLGLLSTWAVYSLDRRGERLVTAIMHYIELFLPAAVFVVSVVLMAFLAWTGKLSKPGLSDLFTLFTVWMLLVGFLVVLTHWGVKQRWRWAARWAAYFTWAVTAITVANACDWTSLVPGRAAKPLDTAPARRAPPATPPAREAPAALAEPRAREFLDRLAKTYVGLKTYRHSAKGHVTRTDDGGKETKFEMFSSTAFIRPDRLRIEYQGGSLIGSKDRQQVIWKRGKDLKAWQNFNAGLARLRSLEEALGSVAGGSAFIAHTVPHLLLGTKGQPPYLGELEGAKRLRDEKLGETPCQCVEGRSGM
jgi:hypothetical protein